MSSSRTTLSHLSDSSLLLALTDELKPCPLGTMQPVRAQHNPSYPKGMPGLWII